MTERILVTAAVLAALAWMVRRLYLWLSGGSTSCSACGKGGCRLERRAKDR